MSQVLARFSLTEVARVYYWSEPHRATRVRLQAVQGDPFGPVTPSGSFEALIVNPEAAKVFNEAEIGQEFDILLTPTGKQS